VPVGLDSVFYAMAGEVPGFAGFVFEGAAAVMYLTDPVTRLAAATEMVGRYLQTTRGQRPAVIVARRATYDFRQLFDWKALYIMSAPAAGMTGAGVCTGENRVCIGIEPGRGTAAALAKADLLGIPRRALKFSEQAVIELGTNPRKTTRRGGARNP
jgi:hypothetical protein